MIKLTDTLMAYHYQNGESKGKFYITINNEHNEDGSLYAAAFDEGSELICDVSCTDRNEIGYLLRDKLVELGYEMEEFRMAKESSVLSDIYMNNRIE